MSLFLQNIIPRIIQYSQELNIIERYVGESWIFIDQYNNNHEYIFMRDGKLHMSLNGIVTTGTWEILPNGKLLVDRISDRIMLENMFIQDAVLILKLSGTNDMPFILINQRRIPDLNVERYLQIFERESATRLPSSNTINSGTILEGDQIGFENGTFEIQSSPHKKFIDVENKRVTNVYYIVNYTYDTHKRLSIKQKKSDSIQIRDKILDFSISHFNFKYQLKIKSVVRINENSFENEYLINYDNIGIITNVESASDILLRKIIIFLIIAVVIFIFFASLAN